MKRVMMEIGLLFVGLFLAGLHTPLYATGCSVWW